MTAHPAQYPLLNTQTVALGQQLTTQAITGPDTSYAPVLVITEYTEKMEQTLKAVQSFEAQYNRFQDKKQSLQDQKQAWDTMSKQALTRRACAQIYGTRLVKSIRMQVRRSPIATCSSSLMMMNCQEPR